MRESKLLLIVGVLGVAVFSLFLSLSVYTGITNDDRSTLIVCIPGFGGFVLLGACLILDYFRRKLILYTDHISYTPAVGRTRSYSYQEVSYIRPGIEHLYLYSHSGKKLVPLELNMCGIYEALYYLHEKGIEIEERKGPKGKAPGEKAPRELSPFSK